MIKILLVDDHTIIRMGVRKVLAEVKDFEVIAEANSGERALELARENTIDVVLMDIIMPGIGGFEATRRLLQKNSELKVIVLSVLTETLYPYHFVRIGVKGYLTKDCGANEIVKAIYKVNSGGIYFESKISERLARNSKESLFYSLAPQEIQIALMVMENCRVSEISEKLHLSPHTIRTYLHRLLKKLGVKNKVGLIRLAIQDGFLDSPTHLE